MRHSINYLITRDAEYLARDQSAKTDRLVLEEDKLLLTDYFFYLMKQLRLCRFSEADRKTRGGKREKIKLGYGGLQCVHCADVPNSRKFFWSNVDRLANSFAEIPGHVLKCRRCPQQTKEALMQLKQFHPEQMARLPRGSQKVFFRRMWRRLHDEDTQANAMATGSPMDQSNSENVEPGNIEKNESLKEAATTEKEGEETPVKSEPPKNPETPAGMSLSTKEAAKTLADSLQSDLPALERPRVLLAISEDKEWLSDMDCFIRKQLEVFCAMEDDVAQAQADRKYPVHVGQVGIRCIHCSAASKDGQGAHGTAVAYPFAISGIYECVREFQRLHLDSCENLNEETKAKLTTLKGSSSLSSVLRKYYVLAAKSLGLHDTREGIRAGGESIPLGSQAASTFSEGAAAAVTPPAHMSSGYPADKITTPPSSSRSTAPVASSSDKKREAPGEASAEVKKEEMTKDGDEKEPPSKKSKVDDEDIEKEEESGEKVVEEVKDEPMEEDKKEEPAASEDAKGEDTETTKKTSEAEKSDGKDENEEPVENAKLSEETGEDEPSNEGESK